jgi:hypothetical protein
MMTGYSRRLLCCVLILSVLAGLGVLPFWWRAAVGLDGGNGSATTDQSTDEWERGKRLDRAAQDTLDRVAAKQQVLWDLIDRRLSLVEAAARFRELDRDCPISNLPPGWVERPGASDEEKQCRYVIAYLNGMLVNDPERAQAETRRLEVELQAVLSHGGRREGGDPHARP